MRPLQLPVAPTCMCACQHVLSCSTASAAAASAAATPLNPCSLPTAAPLTSSFVTVPPLETVLRFLHLLR
jgi:hypothetical protein